MDHLPRDVTGRWRAKEEDRLNDFFYVTKSAKRNLGEELLDDLLRHAAVDLGINEPRRDRVDGNVLPGQLASSHFRKRDDTGLA